jgi:hypothetical protein
VRDVPITRWPSALPSCTRRVRLRNLSREREGVLITFETTLSENRVVRRDESPRESRQPSVNEEIVRNFCEKAVIDLEKLGLELRRQLYRRPDRRI